MKNIKHRIFTINVTLFAQVTSFVNCLLVCPLPPWSLLGQLFDRPLFTALQALQAYILLVKS